MASVFKRDGGKFYLISWYDFRGRKRTKSSRTSDKSAALEIASKLETEASLKRHGVIDAGASEIKKQAKKTIESVLVEYSTFLKVKGSSQSHIDGTIGHIETIQAECEFNVLSDIVAPKVSSFASNLSDKGRSARTVASYLQSIKGFTRWCVKNGKLAADPLVTVSKPSQESDRRLVRRFLTHDEWAWLDSTTRSSQVRCRMPGIERAILYAVAIQTGLRSSEIAQLTKGRLMLSQQPPFILASAKSTKNRKQARQYIQPELAIELRNLTSMKVGESLVFDMPHKTDVAGMFRGDLEAARKAWIESVKGDERKKREESDFLKAEDSNGERLDFHSLRHTTASWLIDAGADIKTIQSVLRHTDIKLTLDRYGHLFPGAEADAVAKIRSVFKASKSATGTDQSAPKSCDSSVFSGPKLAEIGTNEGCEELGDDQPKNDKNQGKSLIFRPENPTPPVGFEPTTYGLEIRLRLSKNIGNAEQAQSNRVEARSSIEEITDQSIHHLATRFNLPIAFIESILQAAEGSSSDDQARILDAIEFVRYRPRNRT